MLNNCFHILDIDECSVGTHDCQQICNNVADGGGYSCDCNTGYDLLLNNTCLSGLISIIALNWFDFQYFFKFQTLYPNCTRKAVS